MDLVRLLSRLSGRISEQGGARSHWWVPSPDGDVSEEGSKNTDPGAGRSGSSRLEDAEPGDGRRRYGFQTLRTNQELLTSMAEARDFTRASPHPPIVEPTRRQKTGVSAPNAEHQRFCSFSCSSPLWVI